MDGLIEKVWDLLVVAVTQMKEKDNCVFLDENKKDEFNNIFLQKYDYIKEKFMKPTVKRLDRHKVASIIIASIIESDVVGYSGNIAEKKVFFGKYLIAVTVGLCYMQNRFNNILKKKVKKEIEEFYFPDAFSCQTPFVEIFARNLYYTYEITDWKLNLLDMSTILYLIECINLQKKNIELKSLREMDSEDII